MLRRSILLFVLLAGFACAAAAADALDLKPSYEPGRYAKLDRSIDPDGLIYGLKFGATEKQVLEALGTPNGVIVISDTRKALLYGKSHLFVFRGGKFRELRIGEHMIHWDLTQQMDGNPFFDRGEWVVQPGIRSGMSFAEVQKLLGRHGAVPTHNYTFDTRESAVTLNFASYSRGGREDGYRLHSVTITSFAR